MEQITPEQFVAAARAYHGAPYRHQGWDQTGMDCRGLLLRAACDAGIFDEAALAEAKELQAYGRDPDGRMAGLLKQYCDLLPDGAALQPGDIIAIRYAEEPQHLVIVIRSSRWGSTIIHATNPEGVIEHRLDSLWLKSHRARIHGVFRLKAFAGDLAENKQRDCECK
jgi:cell wall-associated NlpC family hydrolase